MKKALCDNPGTVAVHEGGGGQFYFDRILRQQMVPRLKIIELSESDVLDAFDECQRRGVRGEPSMTFFI